jgi:hypothetical protein
LTLAEAGFSGDPFPPLSASAGTAAKPRMPATTLAVQAIFLVMLLAVGRDRDI